MPADLWMRASDEDREDVAGVLRDAFGAGRLTWWEFDERASIAYTAQTLGELSRLTADLPSPAPDGLPSDLVAAYLAARRAAWRRRVRRTAACLLVLAAGLSARVLPGAVWLVLVLIPAALVVLFWPRPAGG